MQSENHWIKWYRTRLGNGWQGLNFGGHIKNWDKRMGERYRGEGNGNARWQSDCSDPQKAEDDNAMITPFLCSLLQLEICSHKPCFTLSSKWGREGITTSRKQVRKLRVQDGVNEQPRQTPRLWTSVTIMLMGVGKQGKSCLICLDRLDLVCQQDMPSRHPKMQRQSGLKRSVLKMSLRSHCWKVSLKQASLLGKKCRQKRGSLKQALVRRDLYLEAGKKSPM